MSQRSPDRELLTRYLLGIASAAEREVVEDRYCLVKSALEELLRAEDELIDDYVRGALTTPERVLFEENFLCTSGRRQRLEFTRDLAEALARAKASEPPAELGHVRGLGPITVAPGDAGDETASRPERSRGQLALDNRPELFGGLLEWLDPVRDRAAEKYEAIRGRLIEMFALRGYVDAEDLADATLDRVALKVSEQARAYSGDPAKYVYGVARMVLLEYQRRRSARAPMLPEVPAETQAGDEDDPERTHKCLEKCLEGLSAADRELILQYYSLGQEGKEGNRRDLSQSLGISLNALRFRASQVRARIRKCVISCLEQSKDIR